MDEDSARLIGDRSTPFTQ